MTCCGMTSNTTNNEANNGNAKCVVLWLMMQSIKCICVMYQMLVIYTRFLWLQISNQNVYIFAGANVVSVKTPKTEHWVQIRMVNLEVMFIVVNISYKSQQITKPEYFSSRLAVLFTQSIEGRCYVENEYVVGAAPTGAEWSTLLLPTKMRLIL